MGVYINMEMPKDGTFSIVHIYSDGHVSMPFWGKGMQIVSGITAVPVPPHGRLIDADALVEHKFVCVPHVTVNGEEAGAAYRLGWNTAIEAIMENAETVIGGE